MDQLATLQRLLLNDPQRRRALEVVASLGLADCWIGAGFVRDAAWHYLHGYEAAASNGDIDVVWLDAASPQREADAHLEQKLHGLMPGLPWSVKNQARMHTRNGDCPYATMAAALERWPETATAVAARLGADGAVEINAPLGLGDLFGLRLRPTPAFATEKLPLFMNRVLSKRWLERYPLLILELP